MPPLPPTLTANGYVYSELQELTLPPCPRGHRLGVQALAPVLAGKEHRYLCSECGLRYTALPA
jgi:transposase-like protein